ncbi:hypothetical protein BJ322DRAFT_308982 [Thelephora terrestris]|uniref:WKF domain-containing protein n=1 Tax=Thelephora terrestris TaxID=56493 RepID=A0A9P6H638_9AGAM|nr:hypothetical protein BJ322DRAFT_308982 [Thelephora terrestris]
MCVTRAAPSDVHAKQPLGKFTRLLRLRGSPSRSPPAVANQYLGSGNSCNLEKKAMARKEKQKEEKIAGIPDHSGIQSEIIKKKKKSNDSDTSAESKIVHIEPGTEGEKKKRRREDEQPASDRKKKNKRRKEVTSEPASDPTFVVHAAVPSPDVVDNSEVMGTPAAPSEAREKKKKRRKSGPTTETCDLSTSAIGPTSTTGSADEPEKPRKRKNADGDAAYGTHDAEASSTPKPKKRKKEAAREDRATANPADDRSSRKRKKSKQSIHPDPSDDPELTEQSQKALSYIYSQFSSPETWKFNKARQNWIIRNVWTSKVPDKYVPMVVEYLSRVQGRVRETLVESCKIVVSGSNPEPPASQEGTHEKSPPGNTNPSTPTTVVVEKGKRAEALLHALAKQSQVSSG